MYADDNKDRMVPNIFTGNSWVQGDVFSYPGFINTTNIQNGLLYNYAKNVNVYRCPAAKEVKIGGVTALRVRDYSIEGRMAGGNGAPGDFSVLSPQYPTYIKVTEVRNPSPSEAMVFVDESAGTIDDGYFAISESFTAWQNSPTVRHALSGNFSFVDGHAETHRWQTLTTEQSGFAAANPPTSSNPDLQWVHNAIFRP